jgi:hypothetical protein
MEIGRRKLLAGAANLGLAGMAEPLGAALDGDERPSPPYAPVDLLTARPSKSSRPTARSTARGE